MKSFPCLLAALCLLTAVPAALAEEAEEPWATLNGEPILPSDLRISANQWKLIQQLYELRSRSLRNTVATKLLENEAERREVTVAELIEAEIDPKVGEPTNKEITDLYNSQKAQLGNQPLKDVREAIVRALKEIRRTRHIGDFVGTLQAEADVEFLLDPPRRPVEIAEARSTGPEDAAVTVVEYADYQCPFCRQMQPVLKGLREKYKDSSVRWVFKDLPLTDVHPEAFRAAKAARCADKQGKFWDYSAKLFEQELFTDGMYQDVAKELGLNGKKLLECVESDEFNIPVAKDHQEARNFGIDVTPAFLINGMLMTGARPPAAFDALIGRELEMAGLAAPPEAPEAAEDEEETP